MTASPGLLPVQVEGVCVHLCVWHNCYCIWLAHTLPYLPYLPYLTLPSMPLLPYLPYLSYLTFHTSLTLPSIPLLPYLPYLSYLTFHTFHTLPSLPYSTSPPLPYLDVARQHHPVFMGPQVMLMAVATPKSHLLLVCVASVALVTHAS